MGVPHSFLAMGVFMAWIAPARAEAPQAHVDVEPVRFAVLAFRPKPETAARWQPVVDYLNAAGLGSGFVLEPLTYPELEEAVRARRVGIVPTQPGHYIQMTRREGLLSPLATLGGEGRRPCPGSTRTWHGRWPPPSSPCPTTARRPGRRASKASPSPGVTGRWTN